MTAMSSAWEPGDPLPVPSVAQRRLMFSVLPDHSDVCHVCLGYDYGDAARWPEPHPVHDLEESQ